MSLKICGKLYVHIIIKLKAALRHYWFDNSLVSIRLAIKDLNDSMHCQIVKILGAILTFNASHKIP